MRSLEILASVDGLGGLALEGDALVLDSAWTPARNNPPRVLSIRPAFAAAVTHHDLFGEALSVVDGWADAVGIADRLVVEGVAYWFRMREPMWHWVHERLLWRYAIAALEHDRIFDPITVPAAEEALADVLRALGRTIELPGQAAPAEPDRSAAAAGAARPAGRPDPRGVLPSSLRRALRRGARRLGLSGQPAPLVERRRREALLESRFARIAGLPDLRAIVLTLPSSYQRIGDTGQGIRRDPNLGAVIPAMRDAGIEPIVVGWNVNPESDEEWAAVEADERMLPAYAIKRRWGRPDDDGRAEAAVAEVERRLDGLPSQPVMLDGLDMTAGFIEALMAQVRRVVGGEVRELARVERMVRDLGPRAMIVTQEHHRTPWLLAARRAGIPTFALQHGVLYPAHPGYPQRRHPLVILPSRMFVYGEYERRVLLEGAYHDDEVAVVGSPRLDLDSAQGRPEDAAAEREAVRRELGVADGDRLLVVSTVPAPFIRRSHLVHMLEVVLGGPLPGVHLVFKQHPGERDAGPYRMLLAGLARAGGYEPPPVGVVKDVDLYRLLRAADAHLGQQSTVLTDAVMAGTANLIATVEASPDILGYVAAGVARPVRDTAELLAALADPTPPSAEARRAFLEDHFRPGEAGRRIAEDIRATILAPTTAQPAKVR